MRTYETTFIINPQSDDAAIDQHVSAVTDLITGNGGNILRLNRIGTRRLAYDIQKLSQGYYTDVIFEGPVALLGMLDRFYKLEEPYIRFLTVRFEGELPPEQEDSESDSDEEKKSDDSATEKTAAESEADDEKEPAVKAAAEPEPTSTEEPAAEEPATEADEPETKKEEETPAPSEPAESDDDIL